MSKFFVGQRVRVARPDSGSLRRGLIVGDQGVVVSGDRLVDAYVSVAGKTNTKACGGPMNDFPMFDDELEPILPSGHRASDYSYTELMGRLKAGEVECV